MKKKVIGTILIVLAIAVVVQQIATGEIEEKLQENIGFLIGYFGALAAMVIGGIVLCIKGSKQEKQ